LQVGPYPTNTVAGIELAMDLLHRRKNANKQDLHDNRWQAYLLKRKRTVLPKQLRAGPKIINKCLTLAQSCRRLRIPITTFMLAKDPYLQEFVPIYRGQQRQGFLHIVKGAGRLYFLKTLNETKNET